MKLPNSDHAVVDIEKLHDYCLNKDHPRGKHKARVFESALGLTETDAEEFRQILLKAAKQYEALEGEQDEYGRRYVIDFELTRADKTARLRSGWIIRHDEDFPRLTTSYVLEGRRT